MFCQRCHIRMEEQGRSFHKKRKFTCPKCKKSRMQMTGVKGERGKRPQSRSKQKGWED